MNFPVARTLPDNGDGLDGAFGVGKVASGGRRRPHVDVEESELVHNGSCRSINERRVTVGVLQLVGRVVVGPSLFGVRSTTLELHQFSQCVYARENVPYGVKLVKHTMI